MDAKISFVRGDVKSVVMVVFCRGTHSTAQEASCGLRLTNCIHGLDSLACSLHA